MVNCNHEFGKKKFGKITRQRNWLNHTFKPPFDMFNSLLETPGNVSLYLRRFWRPTELSPNKYTNTET